MEWNRNTNMGMKERRRIEMKTLMLLVTTLMLGLSGTAAANTTGGTFGNLNQLGKQDVVASTTCRCTSYRLFTHECEAWTCD